MAKTKSFCAKQSSKSHTGKINLFCLRRQPFRMMDMLHLYCPMNKPYYDKITCSLTTALLDQCSYSTGQSQCWYQKKQGVREDKLIPSDKHTGKIKFHLGIQNLLLQNERKKVNPFLYKETLFTVLKIIFTIIFGLLVFEQH